MLKPALLMVALSLAACVVDPLDDAPTLSTETAAASSYHPMAFARVSASGGVVHSFNSTGGAVTATRFSAGTYRVDFAGQGHGYHEWAGNAQLVGEGTGNVRCTLGASSRYEATGYSAFAFCFRPDGTPADSAFAVLLHRYEMPPPNGRATNHAYTFVVAGGVYLDMDYNSSGVHNTASRTSIGRYIVYITNARSVNASVMLTAAPQGDAGLSCSVVSWSAGQIFVECRDAAGALADSRFSLAWAVSGPTMDQQGAHAWFNGTSASPSYSAAFGKYWSCSSASVTGSRAGSLASMTVAGDLGSWDTGAFVRASFASKYGAAGYCKIETSSASGTAPTSTGAATVRCYDATGAVVATPVFTFTHVTNNPTGPC